MPQQAPASPRKTLRFYFCSRFGCVRRVEVGVQLELGPRVMFDAFGFGFFGSPPVSGFGHTDKEMEVRDRMADDNRHRTIGGARLTTRNTPNNIQTPHSLPCSSNRN